MKSDESMLAFAFNILKLFLDLFKRIHSSIELSLLLVNQLIYHSYRFNLRKYIRKEANIHVIFVNSQAQDPILGDESILIIEELLLRVEVYRVHHFPDSLRQKDSGCYASWCDFHRNNLVGDHLIINRLEVRLEKLIMLVNRPQGSHVVSGEAARQYMHELKY